VDARVKELDFQRSILHVLTFLSYQLIKARLSHLSTAVRIRVLTIIIAGSDSIHFDPESNRFSALSGS